MLNFNIQGEGNDSSLIAKNIFCIALDFAFWLEATIKILVQKSLFLIRAHHNSNSMDGKFLKLETWPQNWRNSQHEMEIKLQSKRKTHKTRGEMREKEKMWIIFLSR